MKKAPKAFIVAAVALLTAAFGTSPALAADNSYNFADGASYVPAALTGQSLVTTDESLITESLTALVDATAVDQAELTHGFDVEATIAAAKSEVGTSRPTGWSAPGECIMSAQRWILAGGGAWTGSGSPVNNYVGATRLPLSAALPGDIIQYEYIASPHSWATGVHTVLVTGVNDDGTLDIIQSNSPGGSGLVTEVKSFTVEPPAGFQAVVWRF